jgi:hypothetical protein
MENGEWEVEPRMDANERQLGRGHFKGAGILELADLNVVARGVACLSQKNLFI